MKRSWTAFFLCLLSLSAFAQNLDQEAFLDAELRFLAGDYALALEQYDEFLRRRPDSAYAADARYRRAVTLYRLDRGAEAYNQFLTVESRYRATKYLAYIPFWLGVIEYEGRQYDEALKRFAALAAKPPDTETLRQALLYQGKAATALRRTDQAIAAFERLLDERAADGPAIEAEPSALVFLSGLYAETGDHPAQTALWERLEPSALDTATREDLALRAAEAYLALGRPERALPLFESLSASSRRGVAVGALRRLLEHERARGDEAAVQAVVVKAEFALRPDPEALGAFWLRLGAGAFREGKDELAATYFERIAALLPPEKVSAEVPIYLAELARRRGDTAQAYRILSAAAERPDGAPALLLARLGWYALLLGDWEVARARLGAALTALRTAALETAAPDLAAGIRSNLAYALYRLDQPDAALATLSGASPADAHLAAVLYQRTGEAEKSLEAYTALIAAHPDRGQPRVERMALLFNKKQYARVLQDAADLDRFADPASLSEPYRFAAAYLRGVSAAAAGDYASAVGALDRALSLAVSGGAAVPWAAFYRAWSLYRSSRFEAAADALSAFVAAYPGHEQAYTAAYLAAWSYARSGAYAPGVALAGKAAELAAGSGGAPAAEDEGRARYLEGILRSLLSDYGGALDALRRAAALPGAYAVRASFEGAAVLARAGKVEESVAAYAALSRNYPRDPLAEEAEFRRGEVYYGARRWGPAADAFAQYRQAYPGGSRVDAALYLGGMAQKSRGQLDPAILLWERLVRDLPAGRYRFPALLALGQAHWDQQDWEASFNAYTSALAEFGDQARAAGADEQAETLRYLMAKLPEKAARLHVVLNRENGTATAPGRAAALELARFYLTESAQREAGAALADEVVARRREDPGAAAEAYLLKGDYYAQLEVWAAGAEAYLAAADAAAEAPPGARSSRNRSVRDELAPEALFKAARSRLRDDKRNSAAELAATLRRLYPGSTWTTQAERLLEGSR